MILMLLFSLMGCKSLYEFRLTEEQRQFLFYKENDILKFNTSNNSIYITAKGFLQDYKEGNYTDKFATKSDELIMIDLYDKDNIKIGYNKVNTSYERVHATYNFLLNGKDYFFVYGFSHPDDENQTTISEITLNNIKYTNILKLYTDFNSSSGSQGILYMSKDNGFIQLITYDHIVYSITKEE